MLSDNVSLCTICNVQIKFGLVNADARRGDGASMFPLRISYKTINFQPLEISGKKENISLLVYTHQFSKFRN